MISASFSFNILKILKPKVTKKTYEVAEEVLWIEYYTDQVRWLFLKFFEISSIWGSRVVAKNILSLKPNPYKLRLI